MVDGTITQLLSFSRGDSGSKAGYEGNGDTGDNGVNCLAGLLEHLGAHGLCDASFAFLVDEGEERMELLVSRTNASVAADREALVAQLRKEGGKYWSGAPVGRTDELDEVDVEWLLGKRLAREFRLGVMLKSRLMPTLKGPGQYVVLFFFNTTFELKRIFVADWLDILLSVWSDVFSGKLQEFEQCVQALAGSDAKNVGPCEVFEKARIVQSFISLSDASRACEGFLRCYADRSYKEIEQAERAFWNGWHCCPDRPWPCDAGSGRDRAVLLWFRWRLEHNESDKDRLSQAITPTKEALERELLSPADPYLAIDSIHDKAVLLQVLARLGDGSFPLPSDNTEAYEQSKHHVGRFVASVCCGMPHTPESIEAMIWTISEYAYQVLKADPRLHLGCHMRQGARGEASLHMMREFYRNHFFHTVEVCFLGHLFAMARAKDTARQWKFSFDDDSLRQWYIAALLHDIGYAVDISRALKDWLEFFTSESFTTLAKGIDTALKDVGNSDTFEQFCQDHDFKQEDEPWKDHGLVGAHHLYTLAADIAKKGETGPVDLAVKAIAKHNCDNIKIDYDTEPLSALLVLCDVLQAWQRRHFRHYSMGPAWMLSVLMGGQPDEDLPHVVRAGLHSNLKFERQADHVVPRFDRPLVLRLVYEDEVNHDSCVFNMWLDMTRNLQRIDFSGLPFDVLVQVKTPTYTPPKEVSPRTQMGRLFDAVRETHMDYLDGWFPKEQSAGIPEVGSASLSCCQDNRVCYHVDYEEDPDKGKVPRWEMLSFSLWKMNGQRDLMTEDISRFRSDLQRWKKYHQDRSAVGDYSPWRPNKEVGQ